ncbi:MAG: transporter ATP-binding protein [Herbaspirillum sp.]|nr:transporter ATP-binding protein [Herbaspirillum sp.]
MSAALRLSGIRKSFDGFVALDDVSFAARWGEVHALLGENGAGKSSLMNVAAGIYAPEAGEIHIDENPVRLAGPRDAMLHRIGMVHQHFKLVRSFTVAENILLGCSARDHPGDAAPAGFRGKLRRIEREIQAQAAELGFEIDVRKRIDVLSVAEQQRVEILKVLLAGARILIFDEPTAVLSDREAERLLTTVRALARRGSAVVLVTHKMADVKTYADHVTVMRGGRAVATLDPQHVDAAELVRLTVGESLRPAHRRGDAQPQASVPKLSLRGLKTRHADGRTALDGVDLQVRAGEIYGLAGVGGNGQDELANALMGLPPAVEGELRLDGHGDLKLLSTSARRACGIAAIPADRYSHALSGGISVAENFGIGQVHAGRYGSIWQLARKRLDSDAAAAVEAFDVQGVRSIRQKAALLSGGNAQKLVIAREFSKQPEVVLAHSPSRGLDVRAGAEVHRRLLEARDAGAAVLLISEDLDEVMALADRIGVMVAGRIGAEFAQPADRQAIGQAMVDHG